MRYPRRNQPRAGLEFYARLFPKRMAGALDTQPAKTNNISHNLNHTIHSSRPGEFNRYLLPDPFTYYQQAFPNLKGRGKWRQAQCCFHADRTPSLSVNIETGGYYCHACLAKGRDVLDFHMQRHGLAFQEAAKQLGAWKE